MAENLQLDKLTIAGGSGEPTVDIRSLEGVTVREIDWEPLVEGLDPATDPLASFVPAHQYALFFPSFDDFVTVLDEAKETGTPVLRLLDMRSEDAQTHERYERQLCLPVDALSRILGPRVVKSVAMTGSDPYLRTGADLAVLFEARDDAVLRPMIDSQVATRAGAVADATPVAGELLGVPYSGFRSPDRSICSYAATVGGTVVVTNSLKQLEILVRTARSRELAISALPEYVFFRDRYKRGQDGETACLMLSDLAIRQWCSPRWRIGTSRRTRAAAFMSDLQAEYLDDLVAGTPPVDPLEEELPVPGGGGLQLTVDGVVSPTYGTLEFLTPVVELSLGKVSKAEAEAYKRWRGIYQRKWRRYFDPVAVRFGVESDVVRADVTVMPLVQGTDYASIISLTRDAEVSADAGDRHEGTLAHFAMAIDKQSAPVRQLASFATSFSRSFDADPLAWLGSSIAIYAEDSEFWDDARNQADDLDDFMREEFYRTPVAFHAEVESGLKLTGFLAAIRTFVETTTPGMTLWNTLKHEEQLYVRVTLAPGAAGKESPLEDAALYYAASPESLIVTLDDAVMKRALERRVARREGAAPETGGQPWLGSSMCLQVDREVLSLVQDMADQQYHSAMQRRSWANIAILNEWRHVYPERDPIDVHRQVWTTRLVCPGGGDYVWDEQWRTMKSTAYGHPSEPQEGPDWPEAALRIDSANLGITFEEDGLRARAELRREAAAGN